MWSYFEFVWELTDWAWIGHSEWVATKIADGDTAAVRELCTLTNVGPAMARDFLLLGIRSVEQIKGRDPDQLYEELCTRTQSRQDPCVLDTFRAVVHNVEYGATKKWWEFTALRKS